MTTNALAGKTIHPQGIGHTHGKDVKVAGGAATIRQFLRAGLIDDLHLVIAPIMIGSGERLSEDLAGSLSAYECVEQVSSATVTHVHIKRRS